MTNMDSVDALAPVQGATIPRTAGFLPRLGAFVIDCIALGVVGNIIGWTLFGPMVAAGNYARLLGFAIALAYFGIMNSALGGGQTLGKRLLNLRAIRTDGRLLSLPRSMLRYTVLAAPFFLNGVVMPAQTWSASSVILALVGMVAALMAIVTGYLFIFNRPTRRTLHDLVVHSCVVPVAQVEPPALKAVWRGHWVALATITLVLGGAISWTVARSNTEQSRELANAITATSQLPGVRNVGVMDSAVTRFHGETTRFMSVNAQLDDNRIDDAGLARAIAHELLATYPVAAQREFIVVQLNYGYDMGIASGRRSHASRFTPEELRN